MNQRLALLKLQQRLAEDERNFDSKLVDVGYAGLKLKIDFHDPRMGPYICSGFYHANSEAYEIFDDASKDTAFTPLCTLEQAVTTVRLFADRWGIG